MKSSFYSHNRNTRLLFLPVAALLVGLGSVTSTFASTVAQIEAQASGTLVTLDSNPVITAIGSAPGSLDGYTYTNYAILAADLTGSVDLFGHLPAGTTYVPSIGDALGAAGTYGPFDAIPEISSLTSLTKISSGNAVAAAIPVAIAQMTSITSTSYNYLGYYLELQNVEFSNASGDFPVHANGTYTVTSLSGQNPLILYQWASSYSVALPCQPVQSTFTAWSIFSTVRPNSFRSASPQLARPLLNLRRLGSC